jgi:hypothetical protein
MVLARTLVFLAFVKRLKIRWDDSEDKRKTYDFKNWGLFSNPKRTALYLIPLKTATPAPVSSRYSRALATFRLWQGYKGDKAMKIVVPDEAATLHKIGYAVDIRYLSNKWGKRPTLYHHDFESPEIRVYANAGRLAVVGIMGTAGNVMVDNRGIVA